MSPFFALSLLYPGKTPILNHIILVAQSFYSKSHCLHLYQAGPRPSHKQKHFSQCQPFTPLVTLPQRKPPKALERSSQEKGKSADFPLDEAEPFTTQQGGWFCLRRLPCCNFTLRKCEVTNTGQAFIFFRSFSEMFFLHYLH